MTKERKKIVFNVKPDDNVAKDLQYMTPKLFMVWSHFLMFADQRALPVTVTNILNKYPESKSNTHPEGRAIDISIKGWTMEEILKCVTYLNTTVLDYGAISAQTGEPRVVYYHDIGRGSHFHLQVSR